MILKIIIINNVLNQKLLIKKYQEKIYMFQSVKELYLLRTPGRYISLEGYNVVYTVYLRRPRNVGGRFPG